MNKLFFILLIILSLFSHSSISESFTHYDDLVVRNDLYYKKFTNVPFTGELFDREHLFGSIVNGKKEGKWVSYHENGQLSYQEIYKNGKLLSNESYYTNGEVRYFNNYKNGKQHGNLIYSDRYGNKYHQTFKNGIEHGPSEWYFSTGELWFEGSYKDGKKNGLSKSYHKNGNLRSKGYFKNGKEDGLWEYFNEDGSIKKTTTWIDGLKQN